MTNVQIDVIQRRLNAAEPKKTFYTNSLQVYNFANCQSAFRKLNNGYQLTNNGSWSKLTRFK